MDVFQSSSPVSDDIPQEEVMEEEEVSTISVRELPKLFFVNLCGMLCVLMIREWPLFLEWLLPIFRT